MLRRSVFLPFKRFISSQTKSKIEGILKTSNVVVFMKGTKEMPQCGFSRAVMQIMEVQGMKKSIK
jgi:monothiol glutaredoxin